MYLLWKKPEENDAKMNIDGSRMFLLTDKRFKLSKASYILEGSLHGIMTVPKKYKDYSSNSNVLRVTMYMERQWDND